MNVIDTTKMSTRGQVIIPKSIRDYIGAQESTIFTVFSIDTDTIVLKKIDKIGIIRDFNNLRKRTKKLNSAEIINEIREHRKNKNSYRY